MTSETESPLARQLHPLHINPVTQEPYLRLPAPHENIIITPPRLSDAHIIIEYMNDPRVHMTLEGPPHPYLMEHAEYWLNTIKQMSNALLEELRNAAENGRAPIHVNGCPVRSIREVTEDGSDLYIGDVFIHRAARFSYLRDEESESQLVKHNESLPVGDPEIIWDIGDYLAASHHGKGIMPAALRTIINEWAIPRMNAKRIFGLTFKGNIASRRVFEKNGFKMFDTVDDVVEIKPSKGGGKVGLDFLEWNLE